MKAFLAGPMSGFPAWNRNAFLEAHKILVDSHAPASIHDAFSSEVWLDRQTSEDVEVWHRRCLGSCLNMLAQCDTLVLMPGWEKSLGCRMEFRFACDMNMEIVLL